MRTWIVLEISDAKVSDVGTGALLNVPAARLHPVGCPLPRSIEKHLEVRRERGRQRAACLDESARGKLAEEERLVADLGAGGNGRRGPACDDAAYGVIAAVLAGVSIDAMEDTSGSKGRVSARGEELAARTTVSIVSASAIAALRRREM